MSSAHGIKPAKHSRHAPQRHRTTEPTPAGKAQDKTTIHIKLSSHEQPMTFGAGQQRLVGTRCTYMRDEAGCLGANRLRVVRSIYRHSVASSPSG
jgi:hypothetical protein